MTEKSAEVLIRVDVAPAGTDIERKFAEVLAEVVSAERVSTVGHFFTDLGANSLVMAQYCARVRKRPDLPSVSMKDIYQYPTIQSLAAAVADTAAATATTVAVDAPEPPQTAPPTRK
ncbi:acyl carrier protein, partial [Streptomyces sp. MCAF7]